MLTLIPYILPISRQCQLEHGVNKILLSTPWLETLWFETSQHSFRAVLSNSFRFRSRIFNVYKVPNFTSL